MLTDAEFEIAKHVTGKVHNRGRTVPKHCIHALLIVYVVPYMISGLN
jgi:hypothetical protein